MNEQAYHVHECISKNSWFLTVRDGDIRNENHCRSCYEECLGAMVQALTRTHNETNVSLSISKIRHSLVVRNDIIVRDCTKQICGDVTAYPLPFESHLTTISIDIISTVQHCKQQDTLRSAQQEVCPMLDVLVLTLQCPYYNRRATDHYTATQWLVHWPLMGGLLWYSEEGPGRARAPPSPLLAVPNVTAIPPTASVLTWYYLMWHYNCLWTLKG